MEQSPCIAIDCKFKDKHKNRPECENCRHRLGYIEDLGEMSYSVPIEMSDMEDQIRSRKKWTAEDIQYLKNNLHSKTNKQLAEALGRTAGNISVKLSNLGLTRKDNDFKRGIQAPDISTSKKPAISERQGNRIDYFILDFSEQKDLYDSFLKYSKEQFRSPENQILYLIRRAIDHEKDSHPNY